MGGGRTIAPAKEGQGMRAGRCSQRGGAVRVHRTSSGRRPGRAARLGFILVALATAAVLRAADDGGASPSGRVPPPITLTADRIRNWEESGLHYVLLEGHAAVFNGDEGLRARSAVVRIASVPDPSGQISHEVDVYAEGEVRRSDRDGPPSAESRERWTTMGSVKLTTGPETSLATVSHSPAGATILSRAFGRAARESKQNGEASGKGSAPTARAAEPEGAHGLPPLPAAAPIDTALKPTANEEPVEPAKLAEDTRPIRFREPGYRPVQFIDGPGFPDAPGDAPANPPRAAPAPPPDVPPPDFGPSRSRRNGNAPPAEIDDGAAPPGQGPATGLDPLPGVPSNRTPDPPADAPPAGAAPILPGMRRITTIYGGPNFKINRHAASDGTLIYVITGGVNIVTNDPIRGTIDIESDRAIIWNKPKPDSPQAQVGPNGGIIKSADDPMEVYLEGHVIFRQDRRKLQGRDDQTTYLANRAYYDHVADRFIGLDAQVNLFAPGLISPFKMDTPRADQFHPLVAGPNGQMLPSTFQEIRAQQTVSTGSRFAVPGYRFTSRSLDLKKVLSDNVPPDQGGDSPIDDQRTTWRIDARQNFFFMGPAPVFYWPRFVTDIDDLDPPVRMISFRQNNFFGSQVLVDFNGFKVFGIRKPTWIDIWNLDVDVLSARGVGLGSELGWYGIDPIRDLLDPYHTRRDITPSPLTQYFGYFDIWGIYDHNVDNLGQGPAVITFPNHFGQNGSPYPTRQGDPVSLDPNNFRGRFNARHMQSFNTPDDDALYKDFRINLEAGYLTDRNFLEQYYKRLFDTGLDHEDLVYGIKQQENWAATFLTELNPNAWNTETQWLPKLDYYRLGDSLLGDHLTYFGHTGVDWANTHTANDVNNTNTLFFLPYDPVSNTSRTLQTGRYYTSHEIDAPINLDFIRIVPYAQGQLVAWDHQIGGQAVGRAWGGVGGRADIMAWKKYPNVENELMNVHGLNHKIDLMADFRDAWSNVNLNSIGVQDDLDDNSYEMTRRYFAMMNYAGGLLPMQYDPRFLLLRRAASPITQTTDIQATIETLHLGIHQRLQTKRGPEGKRRIIDYLILDLDTTYFPNARRDNFGTPFGQNTYNLEWYIGDRTSIVSYGWFEFFNIGGQPLFKVINKDKLNPNGLSIITSGINLNRPPRGNIFIGYSVIDTGLVQTSALLSSYSYWMSPKWYTTFSSSYDFANQILLSSTAAVTRVGRDYLTTIGLSVIPLQHSYMFAFEISPRLSPSIGLGSGALNRLDTRYAPKD